MTPDEIAHVITQQDGEPVRVHISNNEFTVPTEPVTERSYRVETRDIEYFDAVVDMVEVADGGETVWGYLHVSSEEWERIGLQEHWDHDAAKDNGEERKIEFWSSRFSNYETGEATDFTPNIPGDSPVLVEAEYDGVPEGVPAPLDAPTLSIYARKHESVTNYHNPHDRIELGDVESVTKVSELDPYPEPREPVERDYDFTPPSPHPDIEYESLEPVAHTDRVLEALYVVNKHAKKYGEKGDEQYLQGAKAEARVSSIRKKALYAAKTVMIHRLVKHDPDAVSVELHELNPDVEMWCVYFAEFSFHQPCAAVDSGLLTDVSVSSRDSVTAVPVDFESTSEVSESTMSLDDALETFIEHGVNVNEHLEQSHVEDYTWGSILSTAFSIPKQTA